MSAGKMQALVLRSVGTVECFAFAAVVIPFRWLGVVHAWLGLGEMPDAVVIRYLIREVALVDGLHGVLLWLLARDVERYRPLIIFTGFSYLLGGPVFATGAATAGMPWFWYLGVGLSCLAVGIVVLWLTFFGDHGFKLGSGDGELRVDDYLGEILVLMTTRPNKDALETNRR